MNTRFFTGAAVAGALLLVTAPATLEAQRHGPALEAQEPTSPALGARFGYDFRAANLSLGAHARVPAGPVYVVPSGDLFLNGDDRNWQFNADAVVPLRRLYAGGGVGLVSQTVAGQDETQVGFNLLAGLEMARARPGRTRPFAEGRWTFLDDGSRFHLVLGMNVYTGDPPRRTPMRGRRCSLAEPRPQARGSASPPDPSPEPILPPHVETHHRPEDDASRRVKANRDRGRGQGSTPERRGLRGET